MLDSLTRLQRYYLLYTGGFLMFVASLAVLEEHGMPPRWIGYAFLIFTILMYAVIGIVSRTSDVSEFYVAGRRVPAFFNGMATGADWMSAASFIGLAGTLYLSGYQGLAFVVGWTGGFVLVALLLAPYLRRYGEYTIPDFLTARYGGNAIRLVAVGAAILSSFVYVVAQIYGVGLITSRFVSLQFEIGVFVGLAGILVCSFLGGMRAVTWTQVAQYVILIVAYVTPVAILSWSVTWQPDPASGLWPGPATAWAARGQTVRQSGRDRGTRSLSPAGRRICPEDHAIAEFAVSRKGATDGRHQRAKGR